MYGQVNFESSPRFVECDVPRYNIQVIANSKGSEPLYLRVARALKHEIIGGTYSIGARLPTEDELCKRFGVSRHTVREAIRRLREDNVVTSRQGAGTVVVAGRGQRDLYAQDTMSINDLVSWAAGKRLEIESLGVIPLTEDHALRSGLSLGESWLVVRGLGYQEGQHVPVCLAEYFIHQDFSSIGRLLARHKGPIFPLIEDLFDVKVAEVNQTISATLIDEALASALAVELGAPALAVQRTYRLSNRQIAQVTVSVHPATRYRHSMTLRRVKT